MGQDAIRTPEEDDEARLAPKGWCWRSHCRRSSRMRLAEIRQVEIRSGAASGVVRMASPNPDASAARTGFSS